MTYVRLSSKGGTIELMPVPIIKKMVEKLKMSVKEAEDKWQDAKTLAEKQGMGEKYGYVIAILKKLLGKKDVRKLGWQAFVDYVIVSNSVLVQGKKSEGLDWKKLQGKFNLNISDIKLSNVLRKLADRMLRGGKAKIKSAEASRITEDFKPVADLFFTLLPWYLDRFLEYKYNKSLEKKLLKKPQFKELVNGAFQFLKQRGKVNSQLKTAFKGLAKALANKDNLDYLADVTTLLRRKKYNKELKGLDKKLFNKFHALYNSKKEELIERALVSILQSINKIDSLPLRQLLRSVEHQEVKVAENYQNIVTVRKKLNKKIFGTANPSTEQLEEFTEKKPKVYKEWRKNLNELSRRLKLALEGAWLDKGYNIVPVKAANDLMKSLGLQSPIDPGFKGKVGLGPTPGTPFTYYTSHPKWDELPLNGTPGIDVVTNPDYDEEDKGNAWYCRSLPAGSFTGKRYRYYTLHHEGTSSEDIFSDVLRIFDVIEDTRTQLQEDYSVKKLSKTKITATVCRMADLTYGRMGNRKSEKVEKGAKDIRGEPLRPVYGLHNLQARHFKYDEKKERFIVSYVGKDNIDLKSYVYDPEVVEVLKKLLKGKKKKGYVFSLDKGKSPVKAGAVNKYLKKIGFPGGKFHKFRHYHACRMFRDFMGEAFTKRWKPEKVTKQYMKTLETIAGALGNTKAVCIKSYVSPLLSKEYFEHFRVTPPKTVQAVIREKVR